MLAAGTVLSHYTILSPLGAGAMGEVYRARDSRLGREVAIKVLPEHFADEPERLKRFEREATTLASLNHPNVAQIFGVDQVGDVCFLVLELVPGESLEARLKRGPLTLDEALDVAKQIAEGLEAAHEAGVIHRDLKPANVLITPDGRVKVLDFGLAKTAIESSKGSSTDSVLSTEAGRLLGTPTYMAPEQARGKAIDKRVDVWAFGCVLYECLTAKRAFVGETLTDVLGAVLHTQADLSALPPSTPRRVRELIESCFAKDPRRRLRDIGQARLDIERAMSEPLDGPASVVTQRPVWQSPAVLVSTALLAVAITITALDFGPSKSAPGMGLPVARATLALPKGLVLPAEDRSVAVSPDGTHVVATLFKIDEPSQTALFLRDVSRLDFRALPGTEGASYPFWSPEGKSIAFFSGRDLKRLDLADGIVRVICPAPAGRGGAWSSLGTIVFAPSAGGGLSIVDESGGIAAPITQPASPSESHRVPQMLPDGRRFLFYVQSNANAAGEGVYAFDPASKKAHRVFDGETEAVFVEPSSLVFARDENLVVQPFDLQRLELTGSPKPIAAGVHWDANRAALGMGLSARGTLVYQSVVRRTTYRLAWMDLEGARTPIPVAPLALAQVSLSVDGRRAVVNLLGSRGESLVAALDLERGIKTSIGDPNGKHYFGSIVSLDGQRFITTDANQGDQHFVSFPVGGGAPTQVLPGEPGFEQTPGSITPDGRTLLFMRRPLRDKINDLMTLDLEGQQPPKVYMTTPESESMPQISPLGDIVAYIALSGAQPAAVLKVVTYPIPSTPVQVSSTPVQALPEEGVAVFGWLSARELYWQDASRKVWSATVSSKDGQIDVGAPKPLFDGLAWSKDTWIFAFDIPRERFLIAIEDSAREDAQLILVSDWRPESVGAQPARK